MLLVGLGLSGSTLLEDVAHSAFVTVEGQAEVNCALRGKAILPLPTANHCWERWRRILYNLFVPLPPGQRLSCCGDIYCRPLWGVTASDAAMIDATLASARVLLALQGLQFDAAPEIDDRVSAVELECVRCARALAGKLNPHSRSGMPMGSLTLLPPSPVVT